IGVFIHSVIPVAGQFECSNPLLNKIWRAGRWSYLSNLQGIPTDCPHREKNGWTGDAHLAAEQGLLNYSPEAIYTKWIDDLGDEQIVSLAASLAGNEVDARKYSELAASIKKSFNEKFYQPQAGSYGNGSQTSLSCALYQGLVGSAESAGVLRTLVADVEKRKGH